MSLRQLSFPAIEDRSKALLVGDHLLEFLFSCESHCKQTSLPLSFELCPFRVGLCGFDRRLSVRYFCLCSIDSGLRVSNVSLRGLDCRVGLCDFGSCGLNSRLRLNDSRTL